MKRAVLVCLAVVLGCSARVGHMRHSNEAGGVGGDEESSGGATASGAMSGSSGAVGLAGTTDGCTLFLGSPPLPELAGEIAIGDLNGDGQADLASPNWDQDTLSVVFGLGRGVFGERMDYRTRGHPRSLAIGDFNGDGHPDLALVEDADEDSPIGEDDYLLGVYLNRGDGTFAPEADYPTGHEYQLTGTFDSGLASLLRTDYPITGDTQYLAFGDLDGDGLDDVVVSGSVTSVLFGQTDGTLSAPTEYAQESDHVAVGDLNGDGSLDIAMRTGTLLNRGDGTFDIVDGGVPLADWSLALGDLTGDGILDLAFLTWDVEWVGIAPGNGDGTFGDAVIYDYLPNQPDSVAIGDLDGDGWNDLAVECHNMSVPILLFHRPDGTFDTSHYQEALYPMFREDLNGDGILDVVTESWHRSEVTYVVVMLGRSNGTYETTVVRQSVGGLGMGDVDGDGNIDLIMNDSGVFIVLFGNGDGAFPVSTEVALASGLGAPVYGDFNGDGLLDIVSAQWDHTDNNDVFLAAGLGDGTFADPVLVVSGEDGIAEGVPVEVGDVNADGKLDLVLADTLADLVSVLLQTGDGTFAERIDLATTSSPLSTFIGDLNQDAIPDLAVAFGDERKVAVAMGHGDGSFAAWSEYTTKAPVESVKAGDMDGDGWPDLILQNGVGLPDQILQYEGVFTVLFNDGDGTFTRSLTYPGGGISGAEIVDEDGDGRLDFVMVVDDGESIGLKVLRNTCE